MKDADDWDYILNTVDALFYDLSKGIVSRTGLSLVDAHIKFLYARSQKLEHQYQA
jgi:hypothetical protein